MVALVLIPKTGPIGSLYKSADNHRKICRCFRTGLGSLREVKRKSKENEGIVDNFYQKYLKKSLPKWRYHHSASWGSSQIQLDGLKSRTPPGLSSFANFWSPQEPLLVNWNKPNYFKPKSFWEKYDFGKSQNMSNRQFLKMYVP